MTLCIIHVQEGWIDEEIAALIFSQANFNTEIKYFHPVSQIFNLDVPNYFMSSCILPNDVNVKIFKNPSAMLSHFGLDWKIFLNYEFRDSPAELACGVIRSYPLNERITIIKDCLENNNINNLVAKSHLWKEKVQFMISKCIESSIIKGNVALISLGSMYDEIDLTHLALKNKYSVDITLIHYHLLIDNELIQKYSIRCNNFEWKPIAENIMLMICGPNNLTRSKFQIFQLNINHYGQGCAFGLCNYETALAHVRYIINTVANIKKIY